MRAYGQMNHNEGAPWTSRTRSHSSSDMARPASRTSRSITRLDINLSSYTSRSISILAALRPERCPPSPSHSFVLLLHRRHTSPPFNTIACQHCHLYTPLPSGKLTLRLRVTRKDRARRPYTLAVGAVSFLRKTLPQETCRIVLLVAKQKFPFD